jgi:hypothetical protein
VRHPGKHGKIRLMPDFSCFWLWWRDTGEMAFSLPVAGILEKRYNKLS